VFNFKPAAFCNIVHHVKRVLVAVFSVDRFTYDENLTKGLKKAQQQLK
jgi:hypothetical protein